jgi:hypothetical protein
MSNNRRPFLGFLLPNYTYRCFEFPPSRFGNLVGWFGYFARGLGEAGMQLKYDFGDGTTYVIGRIGTTDVECPFMSVIFVRFGAEIEGDGAVC